MKLLSILSLTLLTLLPLTTAAEISNDLSYYPLFFKEDGTLNVNIIIGKEASTQDILSASEIAIGLQASSPNSKLSRAQFDTDYTSLTGKNIITVGSPCENYASALLVGTSLCEEYLEEGKAYIEVHDTKGGTGILIAGLTPADTYKAAVVLRKAKEYDLAGRSYEITGDAEPYTITPRTLPKLTEEQKILERPSPREDQAQAPPEDEEDTTEEGSEQPVEQAPTTDAPTEQEPEQDIAPAPAQTTTEQESKSALWIPITAVAILVALILLAVILIRRRGGQKGEPISPTQSGYQRSARAQDEGKNI
ncbi:MAG: hypothetical protein HC945_01885 [Nitrosarchaeum sp.]|nr:hypothetical protein [Nitrosarchaeum sp.]